MKTNPALLIIDPQNDFFQGGALAIPGADKILAPIKNLIRTCREKNIPIIATRDWHPPDHSSFVENRGPWPVHCVQDTYGAMFHAGVQLDPSYDSIISNGDERSLDGYSGFEGGKLLKLLQEHAIKTLYICGLATDYCVLSTVLDALKNGFEVFVISDAIKGVDVQPGDSGRAMDGMKAAGAVFGDSEECAASISAMAPTHTA